MTTATHHHSNVRAYLAVFAVLMILTVVTVTVSHMHLPAAMAILIGLLIATIKAGLVAAFFMHLKGEKALIFGLLTLAVVCMAVLFLLPIADMSAVGDKMLHGEAAAPIIHHGAP